MDFAFTTVRDESKQKAYEAVISKSIADLTTKREDLQGDMTRAFEQAGENLDLTKAEVLGSGTAEEQRDRLIELHSELAGVEQALSEKNELKIVADRIKRGNAGNRQTTPDESPLVKPAAQKIITKGAYQYIQEHLDGGDVAAALKAANPNAPMTVEMGDDILNTLFKTGAGWAPFVEREPTLILDAQRPVQVLDLIPTMPTDQHSIKYMEETTFTNAAAEVDEGGAAPEATFALTEQTESVRKIAVHIPVTEEQLDDVYEVEAYLNDRLTFALRQKLDRQVMDGDGTAPNLSGLLDRTGVQTEDLTVSSSKLTKPLNVLLKAKTKVHRVGRAMANAYVLNHYLWQAMALSESSSGGFYMGNPSSGFSMQIWGLPVALADGSLADGGDDKVAGLCGDFRNFTSLRVRKDFELDYGTVNDDFTKGQSRVRGCVRVALCVYRPAAFCKIESPSSGSPTTWTI